MVAWAFHRISGVAIWAFILLHVLDIWLVGANPALYDEVLKLPPPRATGTGEGGGQGPVAVGGTYFTQAARLGTDALLAGVPVHLCAGVLSHAASVPDAIRTSGSRRPG